MKLSEYMNERKISDAKASQEIGCDPVSIGRYRRGERIPGKDIMPKIVKWTGGYVTANDFYDLPKLQGEKKRR